MQQNYHSSAYLYGIIKQFIWHGICRGVGFTVVSHYDTRQGNTLTTALNTNIIPKPYDYHIQCITFRMRSIGVQGGPQSPISVRYGVLRRSMWLIRGVQYKVA